MAEVEIRRRGRRLERFDSDVDPDDEIALHCIALHCIATQAGCRAPSACGRAPARDPWEEQAAQGVPGVLSLPGPLRRRGDSPSPRRSGTQDRRLTRLAVDGGSEARDLPQRAGARRRARALDCESAGANPLVSTEGQRGAGHADGGEPRTSPPVARGRRSARDPVQEDDGTIRTPSDIGLGLVAFFGCISYAALRPAEVIEFRVTNPRLPEDDGWGEIVFSESNPDVSPIWSDDGKRGPLQLKHRARGAARTVPCAPPLVQLLNEHLRRFPPPDHGRIFRGRYGGLITENTYSRVWQEARKTALTATELGSPVARRPCDLRHAAVSTWLAAGVDSAVVAAWAGHSVQVLHRVYAKKVWGGEGRALELIGFVLDGANETD
jgi:hypothetical protein